MHSLRPHLAQPRNRFPLPDPAASIFLFSGGSFGRSNLIFESCLTGSAPKSIATYVLPMKVAIYSLQRFHILHQILFLRCTQPQRKMIVIVIDYIEISGESSIMIKSSLGPGKQTAQWGRAIFTGRRSFRLEIIDADRSRRPKAVIGI